jgi:hypothetical protein
MPLTASVSGYVEFELDLLQAIRAQLAPTFDALTPAPLTLQSVNEIPKDAQGAYLLYYDGKLVYVGKSDAEAGIRVRLTRHFYKLRHRKKLDPKRATFKAARIFSFSVIDVESLLIKHYAAHNTPWNNSGFGSNDPGRERDTQSPSKFDTLYPLDIDRELPLGLHILPNSCPVATALVWVQSKLPYTLRFKDFGGELRATMISPAVVFTRGLTMKRLLNRIVPALPPGWQGTALRGCVILYKESRTNYKSPTHIVRS